MTQHAAIQQKKKEFWPNKSMHRFPRLRQCAEKTLDLRLPEAHSLSNSEPLIEATLKKKMTPGSQKLTLVRSIVFGSSFCANVPVVISTQWVKPISIIVVSTICLFYFILNLLTNSCSTRPRHCDCHSHRSVPCAYASRSSRD